MSEVITLSAKDFCTRQGSYGSCSISENFVYMTRKTVQTSRSSADCFHGINTDLVANKLRLWFSSAYSV